MFYLFNGYCRSKTALKSRYQNYMHPFSMKRLNADTKVHLAHVQAFFVNWNVLLEKKYFCFTF